MLYPIFILFCYILQTFAAPNCPKSPLYDNFYTLPKGYENAKPGDILKVRPVPNKIDSPLVPIDVKNVWQMVVRSKDSFEKATAFVTTLIEPYNADPSKVLSYQTFEDPANITCSPSYGFQFGAPSNTIASQVDLAFMGIALKNGYFVNSPDYEGFNSAFTVVGLWGYSGESLASGWAAVLQPSYAPELKKNIIGASLGGFVTNITAVAEIVDGTLFAGLIPLALTGIGNEYPKARKIIKDSVAPRHKKKFSAGKRLCFTPAIPFYDSNNILTGQDPMIPVGFDLLKTPVLKKIVEANSIVYLNRSYVPEIPIFVYHGSLDRVVPIKDVKKIYSKWCKWGIKSFEFAEDLSNGHVNEQLVGAPAGWTWLGLRFQGKNLINGCSNFPRLSNFFYPGISIATSQYFAGILDSFFKVNLGEFSFVDTIGKY